MIGMRRRVPPRRTLARELGDGVLDLISRAFVELEERDVSDIAIEHDGVGYRWDIDDGASERDRNQLGNTGSGELDHDSAARITLQRIRRL